jgi:trehalose 6-phosphate synthase/phosphatase
MEEDQNSIDAAVKDAVAAVMSTAANTATNTSMSGTCTPLLPMGNNLRIFFVCFHLPVVVVQNPRSGQWRASWSESILAKTEGSRVLLAYEAYWVGTVTTHPPLQTEEDKIAVRKILDEMHCIPIFLDKDLRQAHYNGFCKQVLWPAFHNIDLLDLSTCGWLPDGGASNSSSSTSDWDQSRMDGWWQSFSNVNQEFCTVMHSLTNPNDILWIHDYHLSLLPQQLTELEMEKCGRRLTRKVFFLHIPFPTSQIFRELECGESILQGMLHADVVGFHAFDHARHFLNAAKRILGLNYESLVGGLIGVNYQGKTVLVSMSNVSIEPRMVDAALMLPSVQAGMEELKKKHEGRTIIGAVDIGQRLSGTSLKLLAYERLLQDYPLWQSRAVMVERLLLPGSRQKDEEVTTREVRFLVKRIQDKFGPHVIDYQEVTATSLPMDQRLALWKASAILMSTPIREGLNHWPMEFIYAHKEPEAPGVVIASEFSAISSILNGALRVNPYDIQMMITTIDKALSMDMQEREGRRYRDIDFVSNSPSDKWVKNVLRDLRDATMRQPARDGGDTNSQSSTPFQNDGTQTPIRKDLIDSTAAFLARESSINFAHLNIHETKRAYDSCHRRVIITDFNGTIVHKEPPGKYLKREILGTSGNKPPPDVIDALVSLCNDPKNLVYVVSGDSVENVLNALGHIPNLGLAVSNGARFSPPMSPGQSERRWLTFDLGVDWDAVKRVALPVLSKYTARSNGSFVKLTSFSIGWSYYSCDPEWGSLQAAHLVLELESELRAFDVRFVTLKGIVEVVPRRLNKGLVVKKVLRDVAVQHPDEGPDFILCLGDDISDEKMFTSVFSFLADVGDESNSKAGPPVILDAQGQREEEGQSAVGLFMDGKSPALSANATPRLPERIYAYTVAVGKKQSHANTFVNDAQDVANALVLLSRGEIPAGGVPVWGRVSRLFE